MPGFSLILYAKELVENAAAIKTVDIIFFILIYCLIKKKML